MVYDVIHMIRTQILLTPELYESLKMKAQMESKSLSALIREATTKFLGKKKQTAREILLEMAKDAKPYPNAPKDLATNDDYLYKLP